MKFVPYPIRRLVFDVFSLSQIGGGIANDVFVIVALPDRIDVCIISHPFCNANFKPPHNGSYRF